MDRGGSAREPVPDHNANRGARAEHVALDGEALVCNPSDDFVALGDSLNAQAERAPRNAHEGELRSFGRLSIEETADVPRVSPITVCGSKTAKAWLYREPTGWLGDGFRTLDSRR